MGWPWGSTRSGDLEEDRCRPRRAMGQPIERPIIPMNYLSWLLVSKYTIIMHLHTVNFTDIWVIQSDWWEMGDGAPIFMFKFLMSGCSNSIFETWLGTRYTLDHRVRAQHLDQRGSASSIWFLPTSTPVTSWEFFAGCHVFCERG